MMESSDIIANLLVFILSSFLGIELIRHVSKLLHTPLMSLTNAISSVSIVAALIVIAHSVHDSTGITLMLGIIAAGCAAANAIGGFMITDRILKMFHKEGKR